MATATVSAASPPAGTSTSAPEIHTRHSLSANAIGQSPSLSSFIMQSSRNGSPDENTAASSSNAADSSSGSTDASTGPDPQIIEALRSKDRLYVLKLGEQMESLINERRTRLDFTPATSYQRLLVHRCSAYYNLAPESDNATKVITVYIRSESRIPARRMSELVPVEESAQPAFKIMTRRTAEGPKSRQTSQAGSVAGEDAELSDVEPSETSSIGGRSNTTGNSVKRHRTLEEREAAYNEARSRIFMDFEEKEKEKERDMSANSSTFSLVSGSCSNSGDRGSSVGDLDDSASTVATESEWSGPVIRDKRDGRRGGSSRANRHYNGSESSRNSRATSPSFNYATLYDPVAGPEYGAQPSAPGYFPPPYMYPYGAVAGQMPGPYYPYYVPYGYPPLPHDPSNPMGNDAMYSPYQPSTMPYTNPYMWQQPPPQQLPQPPQSPGSATLNLSSQDSQPSSPQPQNVHQPQPFPPYIHPTPYNPYAMQGYPPPPPAFQHPGQYGPPPQAPGQTYMPEMANNGSYSNGASDSANHSRDSSRSSHGSRRGGAPRTRGSWSYGPGAGNNGYIYNVNVMGGGSDAVGPRLSNRRISGTSSASGSTGARTPGDETSSTTSSSTSSSRQTYTSSSSKHPLPARPDWAVGLKPQPGLHASGPRHHDHSNANSRTMSPARLGGQNHSTSQHQSHPSLQSTDFPPLPSGPEKRLPVVGGAWTNTSTTRSIMTPGGSVQGTALVHYPNSSQPAAQNASEAGHEDDQESGFERPPPKANAELFNPKSGSRSPGASNGTGKGSQGQMKEDMQDSGWNGDAAAGLADIVGSMTISGYFGEVDGASSGVKRPPSAVPPPTSATSISAADGESS
ncbi:uncharacterized protein LAESUDRAFT_694804 [Laetiporus sulphureus 93-53]|uniref:SUZ domain-containing protein n=1 Tax=Laetiporus sulphureus 93-53 TaxID=1314785 RepID=A0A165GCL8_9APHY|nr:uncharacterized protein LAESUDRAFT_694804 [Laetiporus sulphureus 93-53]KZT10162.1 hypothetical protein LAESUDRAFT_694804 [Laetiporus sulphureus 93-53]